jgi:hypothetical protein
MLLALPAQPVCTPAVKTVAGAPARVFCGPAQATVHVGSRTFRLHGGSCVRLASGFTLNIGTLSFAAKTLPPYLGISLTSSKPGRHARPTVALTSGGKRITLRTTSAVTLGAGAAKGSFSGRDLSGAAVRGTFSC